MEWDKLGWFDKRQIERTLSVCRWDQNGREMNIRVVGKIRKDKFSYFIVVVVFKKENSITDNNNIKRIKEITRFVVGCVCLPWLRMNSSIWWKFSSVCEAALLVKLWCGPARIWEHLHVATWSSPCWGLFQSPQRQKIKNLVVNRQSGRFFRLDWIRRCDDDVELIGDDVTQRQCFN